MQSRKYWTKFRFIGTLRGVKTVKLCAEELKFYVLVTAEHHNILAERLNILPEYHNMSPEYYNILAGLKASEGQSIITVTQYKIHNSSAN